jgi:2,5-diamino-6-hydroxy-4-(5-phosphoribosylamino)pyrimidine 1'-reductase
VIARPYVIINVAMTVDGKIDTCERAGAAISSEQDRQRVDRLRASVDAVMVGGRTLHDEDPRLTVRSEQFREERLARGEPAQPAKIGVTSHPALPPQSRFVTAGPARVILFVPDGARAHVPSGSGVEVYECGEAGVGGVDLRQVMAKLVELGIHRLLVEGGGTLNFELLRLGLVDEVQLYLAPLIFGGATAPTLADGVGLARQHALHLGAPQVEVWEDGGIVLRYMVDAS